MTKYSGNFTFFIDGKLIETAEEFERQIKEIKVEITVNNLTVNARTV